MELRLGTLHLKNARLVLALIFLYSCTSNSNQTIPQANGNNTALKIIQDSLSSFISEVQLDSIIQLNGKSIPASLRKSLFAESIPDTIPIQGLFGQLDADDEPEQVIWYQNWDHGYATVLDHKNGQWHKSEPVYLDFNRGDHRPRMDAKARALLTYSYGSGSGYGSEVLNFYRFVDDTLTCVFQLLELESVILMNYCGTFRSIKGDYSLKSQDLIEATYLYEVMEIDFESNQKGRTIFKSRVNIPFHWSDASKVYLPKLPDRFRQESQVVYVDDGEFSFDYFFDSTLLHLKRHGPKWKRRALCNAEED